MRRGRTLGRLAGAAGLATFGIGLACTLIYERSGVAASADAPFAVYFYGPALRYVSLGEATLFLLMYVSAAVWLGSVLLNRLLNGSGGPVR